MNRIIVAIFILGILGLWLVTNHKSEKSIELTDNKNISLTRQKSENIVWNEFSDPELLIEHCSIQFHRNSNKTNCFITDNPIEPIKLFSDALWDIWSGHTKHAKEKLELLQQQEVWSLWGKIGLLELASHTENQKQLGVLLDQFEEDFRFSQNTTLVQSYEIYELWHAHDDLNWDKLEKKLKKYRIEEIAANPDLLVLQSNIYFITGKRDELNQLLEIVKPETKKSIHYVSSLLYQAILEETSLVSIIKEFADKRPKEIGLAVQKARIELIVNDQAAQDITIKNIFEMTKSASKNPALLFDIIDMLFENHRYEEANRVFASTDFSDVELDDFVMFHIISAWGYLYKEGFDHALYKLEEALDMAPRNLKANWLKVRIASIFGRPDLAQNSLQILFESNPYDEEYRNQITYFRNEFRTPEFESLYQRMMEHH